MKINPRRGLEAMADGKSPTGPSLNSSILGCIMSDSSLPGSRPSKWRHQLQWSQHYIGPHARARSFWRFDSFAIDLPNPLSHNCKPDYANVCPS